jgi:hypothetical protein
MDMTAAAGLFNLPKNFEPPALDLRHTRQVGGGRQAES